MKTLTRLEKLILPGGNHCNSVSLWCSSPPAESWRKPQLQARRSAAERKAASGKVLCEGACARWQRNPIHILSSMAACCITKGWPLPFRGSWGRLPNRKER